MIKYFLFALFFVLFASRALGFDLSLAPGLSVKNVFLYTIFLALAVQTVLTRQRKLEVLPVFVPFGLYVGYAMFTWIVILLLVQYQGYNFRDTLISLKAGPVEHFLVLLIFFYGVNDSEPAIWLLRKMVWLIVIGNIVTVIDVLNVPDLGLIRQWEDGRAGGPIGNANEYGALTALFLPAIVAMYLSAEGLKRFFWAIGAALSGLAFLMAVSRGAIVGIAVGSMLGAFYLRAIIPVRTIIRVGSGAAILCVVAVIGGLLAGYGELLLERFSLFGAGSFDASSGRTVIWGRALNSMFSHPVTLVTGFGWYAYESSRYFSFATHNTFLNILYNLGAIGLSLFLTAVINTLRTVRAALNDATPQSKSLLVAFIFGFFSLLVSIFFGELHTAWLYVWAFVGVSLRIAVSETRGEPTFRSMEY